MARDVAIIIKAIDKASAVMGKISKAGEQSFGLLSRGALVAQASMVGLAYGYVSLIKQGTNYNAQLETYQDTLTTVMKSQKKAVQELEWAKKFAASTPFQIPEIVQAYTRLTAYNIKARDVLGTIGDMAAVMGKPLMQAIEAVADAQVGELERLKEFGIAKRQLIEAGAKVNTQGAIKDYESLNEALFKIMKERYAGGMERMSKSWRGVMSNIQDYWNEILGVLSKPVFENVKKDLFSLMQGMDKFKKSGNLGKLLAGWTQGMSQAIKVIETSIKSLIPDALAGISSMGKGINEFFKNLQPAKVTQFIKQIVEIGKFILNVVRHVAQWTFENWKLIAALGAFTILTKVTGMVMDFVKAIIVARVKVLAYIVAHEVMTAKFIAGGTGLLAILGLAAIAWMRYSDAQKKSREENDKYVDIISNIQNSQDKLELGKAWKDAKKQLDDYQVKIDEINRKIDRMKKPGIKSAYAQAGISINAEIKKMEKEKTDLESKSVEIRKSVGNKLYEFQDKKGKEIVAAENDRLKALEDAAKENKKAQSAELIKAEKKYQDEMDKLNLNGMALRIKEIDEQAKEFRTAKLEESKITKYVEASKKKITEDTNKKMQELITETLENETTKRFRELRIQKEDLIKEYGDKIEITKWFESQVSKAKEEASQKDHDKNVENANKYREIYKARAIATAEIDEDYAKIRELQWKQEAEEYKKKGVKNFDSQKFIDEKRNKYQKDVDNNIKSQLMMNAEEIKKFKIDQINEEAQKMRDDGVSELLVKRFVLEQTKKIDNEEIISNREKDNAKLQSVINYYQKELEIKNASRSLEAQTTSFRISEIEDEAQLRLTTGKKSVDVERWRNSEINKITLNNINSNKSIALQAAQEEYDIEQQNIKKMEDDLSIEINKRYAAMEDGNITTQFYASESLRIEQEKFLAEIQFTYQKQEVEIQAAENIRKVWEDVRQQNVRDATDAFNKMKDKYEEYSNAILVGEAMIADIRKGNWFAALAQLVRYVTDLTSRYLMEKAEQKAIQAANWKTHSQYMQIQAIESASLAAKAAIAQKWTEAVAYGVLAASQEAESLRASEKASKLEKEAKTMLVAAVAVKTVGEIAANQLDAAAERQQKGIENTAKKQEDAQTKAKDAAEQQLALQKEIMTIKGMGSQVELQTLNEEAAKYKEMGIDPKVISEWQKLKETQIQGVNVSNNVASVNSAISNASKINNASSESISIDLQSYFMQSINIETQILLAIQNLGKNVVQTNGTSVVQNNTFNGLLDTTSKEQMRELAFRLKPFSDEVIKVTRG